MVAAVVVIVHMRGRKGVVQHERVCTEWGTMYRMRGREGERDKERER